MSTDLVRQWLSTLHDILPKPFYDALDAIYDHAVSLTERYYDLSGDLSVSGVLGSLNLQAILPPLISFLTIYFALISLYRTTSFFVRSTVFLLKWGSMIGVVAASLGYIANTFGAFDQSAWAPQSRRRNPSRSSRPRAWDTFQQHEQWRTSGENPYVADAGRVAREMVEKFVDATQQAAGQGGWWGTLAGMAVKTVVGEDSTAPRTRKRKDGKGKGKSR